jgi:5,10-methylenetetrahydrofolate reductase
VTLIDSLKSGRPVVAAELRPPRAELSAAEGMNAWIDTYHAVRSLTRRGTFVFLTDNAVGTSEEDNLRHLITNIGSDAPLDRVVPFLTTKHTLTYCLAYAERARHHGFSSLVVLGGDRRVGAPRCVDHAWQLRHAVHQQTGDLSLGGWANPYADPTRQIDYLLDQAFSAEFFLTQIVTHHDLDPVGRFVEQGRRRGLMLPGLFGIFYYRSANPRTLQSLKSFLPVPVEALTEEFGAGASADEVCARTIRAVMDLGVRHLYVSNLPLNTANSTLDRVLEMAGVAAI